MLKDITLGQFFPGNTIVHRLDPRTKLMAVILYIVALFNAKSPLTYALVAAVLDTDGRMEGGQILPVTARAGYTVLALPGCNSGDPIRCFFLDPSTFAPLCAALNQEGAMFPVAPAGRV